MQVFIYDCTYFFDFTSNIVVSHEHVTIVAATIPPPVISPTNWEEIENFQRASNAVQSFVTEKTARDALLAYARKHLCYGTNAAQDMAIISLQYTEVFHVSMNSFYVITFVFRHKRSSRHGDHFLGIHRSLSCEYEQFLCNNFCVSAQAQLKTRRSFPWNTQKSFM